MHQTDLDIFPEATGANSDSGQIYHIHVLLFKQDQYQTCWGYESTEPIYVSFPSQSMNFFIPREQDRCDHTF